MTEDKYYIGMKLGGKGDIPVLYLHIDGMPDADPYFVVD